MTPERIKLFSEWLHNQGAKVLDPTNEYELIRFRNANGIGIVYTGKRGVTMVGEAAEGWKHFKEGKPWKLITRKRQALTNHKQALANRDGLRCFVHGDKQELKDLTIEHLLSFSHGGTDNHNNLVLVCEPANRILANRPLSEKIGLIIQMRMSRARHEVKVPPVKWPPNWEGAEQITTHKLRPPEEGQYIRKVTDLTGKVVEVNEDAHTFIMGYDPAKPGADKTVHHLAKVDSRGRIEYSTQVFNGGLDFSPGHSKDPRGRLERFAHKILAKIWR